MKTRFPKFCLFIAATLLTAGPLISQELISKRGYQMPPDPIKKIVLAPRHENVSLSNLSPDKSYFLISKGDGLTPVERLGSPYMNLAGVVVDTIANRSRSMTTGGSVGLELIPAMGGTAKAIQIPAGCRISSP
ncbi:MAG: hypothetical protein IH591_08115, partial [Bacteroidales bacterium]|nr:hypothetical protein [Bacteroidales bacterium]